MTIEITKIISVYFYHKNEKLVDPFASQIKFRLFLYRLFL